MAAPAENLRPAKSQDSDPQIASPGSMTPLIIQTLQTAFSRSHGRPVRVRSVERCAFDHISSFHAERLRIVLDSGECVPVFFKDLNPNHQIETARRVRTDDLGPSYHELRVYERILSRVNLGTPQLYAVRWEPARNIYWIFLEDVGTSRLRDCRSYERWIPAARWAARFHAATCDLPQSLTGFLPSYDIAHYQRCAERVRTALAELNALDRALVSTALDHYVTHIDWFAALPRTVVHGQFFGKNIMIRARRGTRMFAVIDWETAALGPGGFDLVSVSSGRWTDAERHTMWRAYFDEYQARTSHPQNWKDFCGELRKLEIYQALEWIGWWRNRSVSHNFGRWMKELNRIIEGTRMTGQGAATRRPRTNK